MISLVWIIAGITLTTIVAFFLGFALGFSQGRLDVLEDNTDD